MRARLCLGNLSNQRNWLMRKFMEAGFSVTNNHSLCTLGSGPSDRAYCWDICQGRRERTEQREKSHCSAGLRLFLRERWRLNQITSQTWPTVSQAFISSPLPFPGDGLPQKGATLGKADLCSSGDPSKTRQLRAVSCTPR